MKTRTRILLALCFLISAAGFLLESWPLQVVGLAAMTFVGRGFFALPLGLLLDLAYGSPMGALHYIFFPFTILALVLIIARYWAGKYFLDKSSKSTLK